MVLILMKNVVQQNTSVDMEKEIVILMMNVLMISSVEKAIVQHTFHQMLTAAPKQGVSFKEPITTSSIIILIL